GVHPPDTLGKASWGFDSIPNTGEVTNIHGHTYGISICEDSWNDEDFFTRPLYERDPIAEILKLNPEILINSSASPTKSRKEQLKHNMLSFVSQKYSIPYCYVNQVGAVDDISFEGASRVYGKDGKLVARAKSFSEQFMIVNPLQGGGKIYPLPRGLEQTITEERAFSLNYENDLERTYLTIVQGIRDYYKKTGFKKAVLGLSGGLDSTICATLLADALGPENVYGISMPSEITPGENRTDARQLAENLGINFMEAPIGSIVDTVNNELSSIFKEIDKKWDRSTASTTKQNAQARIRALILWSISNEFKDAMPIATSDKSEIYLGYATINGDMSGGFAPIADVAKTKLFALGTWLNENRGVKNAIPESILKKKPSADLEIDPKTGVPLTAEDDNMPYEFLDEIIWRIENLHQDFNTLMNETFLYEAQNNITKGQKEAWLDKFYRKMSFALYKWSILPPSVLVDSRSINKADYRQPIVSGKINWKGESTDDIEKKLDFS
ncbi:MAG: NAD(+) synthase, partial [Candidatus Melainabacteria bacterium]|nr:NAD(+) synthase [Candidatus Melainabacteria bacterium]